ncbi:uncharacterized protein LOC109828003 isoform X2 [Asparagus officinalis]|uniref:uncharacterized protein LOC109828003 isoform X1 n=1 Tax=Asparagus officinalis TaxID=4686 RepID=UPI00098DEDB2|nr:uncharacterized protein LOC109828003 isoform X1 [Asparagus officinalis]XP_020250617.1 uncharacterized protein LOC109828003 isoform X2 [Asparagus officinalis]
MFQGRVSVADIIGFSSSEMISSKPDGSLKAWESYIDLENLLKHEIHDGQLSFRGKQVLEVISKQLFDVLREKHREEFNSFITEKVSPIAGDITIENLGTLADLLGAVSRYRAYGSFHFKEKCQLPIFVLVKEAHLVLNENDPDWVKKLTWYDIVLVFNDGKSRVRLRIRRN